MNTKWEKDKNNITFSKNKKITAGETRSPRIKLLNKEFAVKGINVLLINCRENWKSRDNSINLQHKFHTVSSYEHELLFLLYIALGYLCILIHCEIFCVNSAHSKTFSRTWPIYTNSILLAKLLLSLVTYTRTHTHCNYSDDLLNPINQTILLK